MSHGHNSAVGSAREVLCGNRLLLLITIIVLVALSSCITPATCAQGMRRNLKSTTTTKTRSSELPTNLTIYAQGSTSMVDGVLEFSTILDPYNETIGLLSQNLTDGANASTSKRLGMQYGTGTSTNKKDRYGALFSYLELDNHIDTDEYSGTFLIHGTVNESSPLRVLSIIGGTGDFYLARGYALSSTPDGTAGTFRYECHFDYN